MDTAIGLNGKLTLTPEEIQLVASQFARGSPRYEVAKVLQKHNRTRFPEELSLRTLANHLRKYDPTSTEFAKKHSALIQLHRDAITEALGEAYAQVWEDFRERVYLRLGKVYTHIAEIDGHIESLEDEQREIRSRKSQSKMMDQIEGWHKQYIDIDKQLLRWYERREKQEKMLFATFFGLREFEAKIGNHASENLRVAELCDVPEI